MGADPTTIDGHVFEYVFGIDSEKDYFWKTKSNLRGLGLMWNDVYIQNLIHSYQTAVEHDNPDWEVVASKWLPVTKAEFDAVDPSLNLPVLITIKRLLNFLMDYSVEDFDDYYKGELEVPILAKDNKLKRPLIPVFDGINYKLDNYGFGPNRKLRGVYVDKLKEILDIK